MTEKKTLIVGIGEVGKPLAQVLEVNSPVLRHDLEPVNFDDPIGIMHICFPFRNQQSFCDAVASYVNRF